VRYDTHMNIHILSTGFGLSFLLEYPHGLYLIDTGSPGRQAAVLGKMKSLGRTDLKLIWITHYDHYGSAAALRAQTGAPVAVHPADAESLAYGLSPSGVSHGRGAVLTLALSLLTRARPLPPARPDFLLEDGSSLERFGLGASILHTPGHTPGHTCVLLEDGTAFAADLIARNPRPRLQDLLATDWTQLQTSLARLQAVGPQRVYTGHSRRPITGTAFQQIRAG
jgi:hydroxyacylglutathione hydrolase